MTGRIIWVLSRPVALRHDGAMVNCTKDISRVPPKAFWFESYSSPTIRPAELSSKRTHLRIADGAVNRSQHSPDAFRSNVKSTC